jgi:hypothetical protein
VKDLVFRIEKLSFSSPGTNTLTYTHNEVAPTGKYQESNKAVRKTRYAGELLRMSPTTKPRA